MRVLPCNARAMNQSIEEEEVAAQRDAAVSLFKGLQQRVCLTFAANSKYTNLAAFVVLLFSSLSPTTAAVSGVLHSERPCCRCDSLPLHLLPRP